jgi:Xaa-Pro dipeptidase
MTPSIATDLYAAHVTEIQQRWERSMEAENFDAVLVHAGTPLISYLDDYEYAFRPNPHFLAWLPLTHHHDSVLLIRPGAKPRLFFYQPDDYWYLPPSDPDPRWADHFEVSVVRQPDDWRGLLPADISMLAAVGDAPVLREVFDSGQVSPRGLVHRLHLHRTRKTDYEIACMREASTLAARAHLEAEAAFRQGLSEFHIHQRYLGACGHADAQLPYNNIVALNGHGAVLHYQGRDPVAPQQSLSFLIDAGCTVNAYASDITRTYAAGPGRFAELVEAMDGMQQALLGSVLCGADYADLHLEAHLEIAKILAEFGIIKRSPEQAVESGLSSVFYPHGLGHFIGLQTHDVAGLVDDAGNDIPRPDGHPFLRLTRVLEPGNVLTIEPGLYFIEPLLRRWKENGDASAIDWDAVDEFSPYGGVRIEDNILVTEQGNENLTRPAFEIAAGQDAAVAG